MKVKSLLDVQQNASTTDNSNSSNEELIKRNEIPKTPFTIISVEEGHFGTLGKYRITEIHDTYEEAKQDVEEITWDRIVQVIGLLHQILTENKLN